MFLLDPRLRGDDITPGFCKPHNYVGKYDIIAACKPSAFINSKNNYQGTHIFNREKLRVNRNKAVDNIAQCQFFKYAAEDIMLRLNLVDNDFSRILDLGCRTGYLTKLLLKRYIPDRFQELDLLSNGERAERTQEYVSTRIHENNKKQFLKEERKEADLIATDISELMLESFDYNQKLLVDEEKLELNEGYFDLITFSLGLHWINDVQGFLSKIKRLLKPNGIFIANFIGGNSLKKLRLKLIEAEIAAKHSHSAHISPFIHFDHVTPLLSTAGFTEIIVDYENIELEYNSPLDLMKELKNIGESNILVNIPNYAISKRMMAIIKDETTPFYDQINLISFIASPMKSSIKLNSWDLDC